MSLKNLHAGYSRMPKTNLTIVALDVTMDENLWTATELGGFWFWAMLSSAAAKGVAPFLPPEHYLGTTDGPPNARPIGTSPYEATREERLFLGIKASNSEKCFFVTLKLVVPSDTPVKRARNMLAADAYRQLAMNALAQQGTAQPDDSYLPVISHTLIPFDVTDTIMTTAKTWTLPRRRLEQLIVGSHVVKPRPLRTLGGDDKDIIVFAVHAAWDTCTARNTARCTNMDATRKAVVAVQFVTATTDGGSPTGIRWADNALATVALEFLGEPVRPWGEP
ncbi:hypothetical protein GGF32_001366 [Allomyces javanicus]|nr:hypothetical protein GGF32_001366 [Allomyces javanicus]